MTATGAKARGGRPRGGGSRPVDALVAEIGSTTTVVSAFAGLRDVPGDDALPRRAGRRRHVGRRRRRHRRRGRRPGGAGGGARRAGRARAHAGDELGCRRPQDDRPRPHAAHDGHGGARGRPGGRRGGQVPDRRPPAGARPARDRRRAPQPHPARRRGGGRRLRHGALQRRAAGEARGAAHRCLRRQQRRVQRRAGTAGAGRLPGQAHRQRVSGRGRARHRAGPRT